MAETQEGVILRLTARTHTDSRPQHWAAVLLGGLGWGGVARLRRGGGLSPGWLGVRGGRASAKHHDRCAQQQQLRCDPHQVAGAE